ncbi:response regulator [Pleurocapsales cyanobacterium LEGE 10410]|nr:response regulator [Pleurocapsales cyanobacterium LEGE 10410]
MPSKTYQSNQLNSILDSLFQRKGRGILNLKTKVPSWQNQRSCVLALYNGALVYGGIQIPSSEEFCRKLGQALKPDLIEAALSVANEKVNNPESFRELLELLTKMRVFTWQEVEALMTNKIVLTLEKFLSYPGEAQWQATNSIDLSYGKDGHGLNWSNIQRELEQRQHQWQSFAPKIPSMDAIPVVTPQQLALIDNHQVRDHFRKSVDGKKTLIDIAEKIGKDPLKVSKNYFNWVNNGWVSFETTPQASQAISQVKAKISANIAAIHDHEKVGVRNAAPVSTQSPSNSNLPIVLSVDDSPIIQISIKRALQEHYNVLLANNAAKALDILNQNSVKLLLLDLTMPDVDGLEFCQSIRQISKFRDLPIVMVTARDGLVNKMKGHIAGTSKYLTKPFKPEELREIVRQLIAK